MKMKRILSGLAITTMLAVTLTACNNGGTATTTKASNSGESSAAASGATTGANNGEKPYIPVISKGLQHQFWQVVKKGAEAAASEYGVEITFEGPASESEISAQVQMLDSALAKKPAAIALAALSTEAIMDQLNRAVESKIPIIGFDSGVPNAPEGAIKANASTDNYAAGELAATSMYPAIKDKVKAATTAAPVRIAVVSQDATSESVGNRTKGFIDKMVSLIEADGIKDVAVAGHDKYSNGVADNAAAAIIDVSIPATTSTTDLATTAGSALSKDNVIAAYASNEGAANGILDASEDGATLPKKNIVAVGFDAGARQKAAVAAGYFLGSITQDPYNIGYMAVKLAYQAYKGETVKDVDTGAKFYTKDNMNDAEIKDLLYD